MCVSGQAIQQAVGEPDVPGAPKTAIPTEEERKRQKEYEIRALRGTLLEERIAASNRAGRQETLLTLNSTIL